LWNGGIVPYGCKKENKKLIVNPKEAEIVRMIYETYITTGSLSKIYNELKTSNIRNRQGEFFNKSHLENILRNVVYTGKVKYAGKIYQGIHKPIISEEIFNLAQQIHKKKVRKLRVYKNFLFGGLIKCKECGSKMTPCFTNKRKEGKLKRYYYYRCTSTLKRDWQSCSTRQVSAERLENYILENLERISLDKNYIDNLVFKLNHTLRPSYPSGYELTNLCSKFSSKTIRSILTSLLSTLLTKKSIERNLLIKKFIKEIIYSKENIKITFFYSENFKNFSLENSPARRQAGRASVPFESQESLNPINKEEFVSQSMAPAVGLEPTTHCLHLVLMFP